MITPIYLVNGYLVLSCFKIEYHFFYSSGKPASVRSMNLTVLHCCNRELCTLLLTPEQFTRNPGEINAGLQSNSFTVW